MSVVGTLTGVVTRVDGTWLEIPLAGKLASDETTGLDKMSINTIGGGQTFPTQQVQGSTGHGHGQHGMRKTGMDAAAQALGMSSDDLRASLKSGKTLSALAQAKGVSTDALTTAISDALKKANPSLSSDRAALITQRMINGAGSSGPAGSVGQVDRDHDGDSR